MHPRASVYLSVTSEGISVAIRVTKECLVMDEATIAKLARSILDGLDTAAAGQRETGEDDEVQR